MNVSQLSKRAVGKIPLLWMWLGLAVVLVFFRVEAGNVYYVDNSMHYSVGFHGFGSSTFPWNDLTEVNNFNSFGTPPGFSHGDIIYINGGTGIPYTASSLANRGSTLNPTVSIFGALSPQGSGIAGDPITIDAYYPANKPLIDAQGVNSSAAILLYNQDYLVIRNIEIINDKLPHDVPPNNVNQNFRWGILVYYDSNLMHNNISICNCYIHDVYGSYCKNPIGTGAWIYMVGGIYIWANAGPGRTQNRIDNVLISDNQIENICGQGICFRGESPWDGDPMNWSNLSTNIVIRRNTITTVCDGIQPIGVDNVHIEYNIVNNAGGAGKKDPLIGGIWNYTHYTGAVAGIWPSCSRGGLIQYNEVKNTRMLPGDGFAFDNDDIGSGSCIFQYNYSHANEGGFFMDTYKNTEDESTNLPKSIVRYNISQNDALGIVGGIAATFMIYKGDGEIYNNTIYTTGEIGCYHGYDLAHPKPSITNTFSNNIFYGDRSAWNKNNSPELKNTFTNNCYFGRAMDRIGMGATHTNILTEDPLIISPGSGSDGLNSVLGYKLQPGSKCINRGALIANSGGRSFWGVSINGKPDIGAYERPDITPILNLLLGD
jgi:hypothetical protein